MSKDQMQNEISAFQRTAGKNAFSKSDYRRRISQNRLFESANFPAGRSQTL